MPFQVTQNQMSIEQYREERDVVQDKIANFVQREIKELQLKSGLTVDAVDISLVYARCLGRPDVSFVDQVRISACL